MGFFGTTFKIITFPFRLLFGPVKKKEDKKVDDQKIEEQNITTDMQANSLNVDNIKGKIDLMLAQVDSLKLEYETINQRIQNIERMVRELYAMAKS